MSDMVKEVIAEEEAIVEVEVEADVTKEHYFQSIALQTLFDVMILNASQNDVKCMCEICKYI